MTVDSKLREAIRKIEIKEYASGDNEKYKINLSLNINPFGVSKKVLERLKTMDINKIHRYYPENRNLVQKISEKFKINTDSILLGDGCDGCLETMSKTFIEKGDNCIIPIPTFHRYEFHTRVMGGFPSFVEMKNFELNPNEVLSKIDSKTKLIFLCDPNNPTGISISNKTKEKIAEEFSGIIVVDEALADMSCTNSVNLVEKYENIIIAKSFSKTFGLASLRIGYIISSPEIILNLRKTTSPFKVNGLAQELAMAVLDDSEYIKNSIKYIETNRNYLVNELEKMNIKCTKSVTTNFLADVSKLNITANQFIEILRKKSVGVVNAKAFGLNDNRYVRISVGNEAENKEFIKIIKETFLVE